MTSWTRHAAKARGKEMEDEGRGNDRGGRKGKNVEERCTWVTRSEEEDQTMRTLRSEDEEDERVEVAPNMKAGGSHPQATFDPEEAEEEEKQQRKDGQYSEPGHWVMRPNKPTGGVSRARSRNGQIVSTRNWRTKEAGG